MLQIGPQTPPETCEASGQPVAESQCAARLRQAGLRPTRQRCAIAEALFGNGPRHVCADDLFQEMGGAQADLSLATLYNALNQFAEAGLIRRIGLNGGRGYFDTDTGSHHHFYLEDEGRILDIEDGALVIGGLPEPPAGYEICEVDVVVRLCRPRPAP